MLTPLATPLVIGLLAVTFGWTPAQPAPGEAEADAYEYHLRLSEADLEAIRTGRVDSLSSELPRNLSGFERVRITFGEGNPARVLTRRDRQSPRRIAAAGTPEPHVVAKPIVAPEWGDAAKLASGESPSAQRWTVRQGQGAFGPGGIADDIRNGAQRTGSFLQGQTQNLVQNTQGLLQQGGDTLRQGAQNLANNTGQFLENNLPPTGGVFGRRPPQNNQAGQQTLPPDNRVIPPAPTATGGRVFVQDQNGAMPLAGQSPTAPPFNQGGQGFGSDLGAAQGPQLTAPAGQGGGLVQSFAAPDQSSNRQLTPIRQQRPSNFDAFANEQAFGGGTAQAGTDPSGNFSNMGQQGQRPFVTQTQASGFPPLQNGMSSGGVVPLQQQQQQPLPTFQQTVNQQLPAAQVPVAQTPPQAAAPVATNVSSTTTPTRTGWVFDQKPGEEASQPTADSNQTPARDTTVLTIALVFLAGFVVYTWTAYYNLRNRYLMALRGVPQNGYNPVI